MVPGYLGTHQTTRRHATGPPGGRTISPWRQKVMMHKRSCERVPRIFRGLQPQGTCNKQQSKKNSNKTPGTYPRPSTTCLWKKSFHFSILRYLHSVCSGGQAGIFLETSKKQLNFKGRFVTWQILSSPHVRRAPSGGRAEKRTGRRPGKGKFGSWCTWKLEIHKGGWWFP